MFLVMFKQSQGVRTFYLLDFLMRAFQFVIFSLPALELVFLPLVFLDFD
jgi:hypothetical protein